MWSVGIQIYAVPALLRDDGFNPVIIAVAPRPADNTDIHIGLVIYAAGGQNLLAIDSVHRENPQGTKLPDAVKSVSAVLASDADWDIVLI